MGWKDIDTAPRDGTWFWARSTEAFYDKPRLVHFADEYDRLPINYTDGCWSRAPTQWRPKEG